jgi:hypothetical protein
VGKQFRIRLPVFRSIYCRLLFMSVHNCTLPSGNARRRLVAGVLVPLLIGFIGLCNVSRQPRFQALHERGYPANWSHPECALAWRSLLSSHSFVARIPALTKLPPRWQGIAIEIRNPSMALSCHSLTLRDSYSAHFASCLRLGLVPCRYLVEHGVWSVGPNLNGF